MQTKWSPSLDMGVTHARISLCGSSRGDSRNRCHVRTRTPRKHESRGRAPIGPRASVEGCLRNRGATCHLGPRASGRHLCASGNCDVHSSCCALRAPGSRAGETPAVRRSRNLARAILEADVVFARADQARMKTQREQGPQDCPSLRSAERIAEGCFRSRRISLYPRRRAAQR